MKDVKRMLANRHFMDAVLMDLLLRKATTMKAVQHPPLQLHLRPLTKVFSLSPAKNQSIKLHDTMFTVHTSNCV